MKFHNLYKKSLPAALFLYPSKSKKYISMIQRDGHNKSLWQQVEPYVPQNSWSPKQIYDVLIVGGGITGLTTAVLLQEAGKKCVIAEAHTLGFGTTSGTTGHLNTLLDTPYNTLAKDFGKEGARLIKQGTVEAIALVQELSQRYQINADFLPRDGYLYAQDDKEAAELEEIKKASEEAGCIVEWADTIPVPDAFIKALKFGEQAQIHSTQYLLGLARAFEAAGGVILENCLVGNIKDEEPIVAETALGDIACRQLVWAIHTVAGVNVMHFQTAPYRSYAVAIRLTEGLYPEALAYDMKDPYNYFRTQEVDGEKYLIAGGFDHKSGQEEATEQRFRELEAYLHHRFSFEAPAYRWSSQYFTSTDGLPFIGNQPGNSKNVWCATGYGGNGITFGSLAGKMLSDGVLGRENAYAELLSPARIKPIAEAASFLKENLNVVKEFIGKRFEFEKLPELADLAPGEAKLANWNGKKVAIYKDPNGKIEALDPVCPHAHCIVAWNATEVSWDCPCHGARFAPNGTLISGPARHGLKPLLWEDPKGD